MGLERQNQCVFSIWGLKSKSLFKHGSRRWTTLKEEGNQREEKGGIGVQGRSDAWVKNVLMKPSTLYGH